MAGYNVINGRQMDIGTDSTVIKTTKVNNQKELLKMIFKGNSQNDRQKFR